MDGVCMVGLVSPSGHAKQNRKGENVLWWGHRYRCPHHRAQTGIGLLKHGKRAQEVPRGLNVTVVGGIYYMAGLFYYMGLFCYFVFFVALGEALPPKGAHRPWDHFSVLVKR